MKAILFRDRKAFFSSFKNWGMVLAVLITAVFAEMIGSGSGMLDPFTWAVYFGPYFICSSCSVMVSILYQDFRDGLFDLYMQSGRSYWSWCRLKCVFPVILTVVSVLANLILMWALSSGSQPIAGMDDAAGAFIVSILGTVLCSLGAMPLVYTSRNDDPTLAQLLTILIAVLIGFAYMLVIFGVVPLWMFMTGYVALAAVAISVAGGAFSRYFVDTNVTDDSRDGGDHAGITVDHVTFGYKPDRTVLEDIDLTVPQGQSLAILGYNGVGKTTLFRLITGLLRPREGRCVIDRRLAPSMRDVFQMTENGNLVGTMTVRDNIRFRQLLFRTGKGRPDGGHDIDPTRLEEEPLVRAFELTDHLDKKVSELSTGLRKRAGLVAGMLFDPHVIMLDEPSNAIDPITRSLLIDYIGQLRADGRTILTVTHDLEYCWNVADRIVILDDRHVVKDMALAECDDYEAFTKAATLGRERTHVDFGIPR